MCSRPRSTLTAYLMRELIKGHQERLLSRDLDRVLMRELIKGIRSAYCPETLTEYSTSNSPVSSSRTV